METTYSGLPQQLLAELSNTIHDYTTAIVMYTSSPDGKEIARLVGSGTFVVSSNTFGILTAGHVTECLKNRFSLGLSLRETEYKYTINSDVLTTRTIARGREESVGPDLGLIILPDPVVGWIKARRNFYNLDQARQYALTGSFDADIYAAALCGIPDVLTTDQPSERGFATLRQYKQLCLFGSIGKTYTGGDFDYCDSEIDYSSSQNIPETFGGVSGGGLWLILLKKRIQGTIEAEKYILHGVAFYQTSRTGRLRSIKCHGPKSIYEKVWNEMNGRS